MSDKILLDNITTSSAPAIFTDQISFQVTFTAFQTTIYPLTWKIIYVGSAYSQDHDQILQQFEIQPLQQTGTMKFDIVCQCPDPAKIPRKQLLCVTALIITASYDNQEFIRVGYYVHNQFIMQQGQPQDFKIDQLPLEQLVKRIKRTIISDKPRVTKFNINWNPQKPKRKSINQEYNSQSQSQSKLSDYYSISINKNNNIVQNSNQNSNYCQQDSTSQKRSNQKREKIKKQMKQNLVGHDNIPNQISKDQSENVQKQKYFNANQDIDLNKNMQENQVMVPE